MARADLLHKLMYRNQEKQFKFEALQGPLISQVLTPYDVKLLDDISRDPRLVTKLDQRLEMNDNILRARGFVRTTQGTNRAVYKYLEDQSFVLKVAISVKGREDSPKEFKNQLLLKPFVTRCFDVSPTGVVGTFERVDDITSKEQFLSIADNVFDLINHIQRQGYILADIGTNFFRNYGIRIGFGPVLLDYPMLYKLDGNKLYCKVPLANGRCCGGELDFDEGFNFISCTKCGVQYSAKELEQKINSNAIEVYGFGDRRIRMKVAVVTKNNDNTVDEVVNEVSVGYISSDAYVKERKKALAVTDKENGIQRDENPAIEDSEPMSEEEEVNVPDTIVHDSLDALGPNNEEVEEEATQERWSQPDPEEEEETETLTETITGDFYQYLANTITFSYELMTKAKDKALSGEDLTNYTSLMRVMTDSVNRVFDTIERKGLIDELADEINTTQVSNILSELQAKFPPSTSVLNGDEETEEEDERLSNY